MLNILIFQFREKLKYERHNIFIYNAYYDFTNKMDRIFYKLSNQQRIGILILSFLSIGILSFIIINTTIRLYDDIQSHKSNQNSLDQNICNVTYASYSIERDENLDKFYVLHGTIEYDSNNKFYQHKTAFKRYMCKTDPLDKIDKQNESLTCYTNENVFRINKINIYNPPKISITLLGWICTIIVIVMFCILLYMHYEIDHQNDFLRRIDINIVH